jgi:nucleoside-diphosphate-sugar epimerase
VTRTVAVTGAEGFVGRHVVDRLLAKPDIEVIRIVRPGSRTASRDESRAVSLDVLGQDIELGQLPIGVDVLVHLAWSGLNDFRSDVHLDQVRAHERFLQAWLESGVRRIVGVGTCLEYGLIEGEMTETMPTDPVIAYAQGKSALHDALEELVARFGASCSWARVFYPYGDGQQPKSLWSSLQSAIARGDATFPMSGGEQVRDYLHVDEVGSILASLALLNEAIGVVNVCSGQPVVLRDLIEGWIADREAAIRPQLGVFPYPDYEPMKFWGSRSKLDQSLGERVPRAGSASSGDTKRKVGSQ